MTWLFAQVWLWSLAAFALGSLLTWWLFVRPLRRELRELAPVDEPEEAWDAAPEEAPLDLLRDPDEAARTDDELEFVRGPEEPTFGDWDRPARWGPHGRRGADESAPAPQEQRDPAVPRSGELQLAERSVPVEPPEVEPADGAGRNTWFRNDELDEPDPAAESSRAGESPQVHEWSGTLDAPAGQDGSGALVERGADRSESADSSDTQRIPSWERSGSGEADERDGASAEPGNSGVSPGSERDPGSEMSPDSGGKDEDKSARLRSLFEPDSGADQARAESGGAAADEQSAPPLTSDPGAAPSSEVRNVDGSPRAVASAADFGGGAGALVKAHFASQQYHTPESPQYDRIAAEAWFRSATDAEQAGFEPWDGNPRAGQN